MPLVPAAASGTSSFGPQKPAAPATSEVSAFAPRTPTAAAASDDILPFAPRTAPAAAEPQAQPAKTPLGVPLNGAIRGLSAPLLVERGTGSVVVGLISTCAEANSLACPVEVATGATPEENESFLGKLQRVVRKAGKSVCAAGRAVRDAPGKAKREFCRMMACCVPATPEFGVEE